MNIDVRLMVTYSKLSYQFMDKLGNDLESRGMQPTIYTVLAHLNNEGRSKTQKLAEVAVISSGTITHHINKLVSLDYVTKTKDDKDKRISWIDITPKGRKVFKEVHEEHLKYLENLLSVFNDKEKEEMIKQLKYFGKKLKNGGIK
jgi:MarR family 2-MHQ and catechol resistance regulon transcriptional repressor